MTRQKQLTIEKQSFISDESKFITAKVGNNEKMILGINSESASKLCRPLHRDNLPNNVVLGTPKLGE